MTDGKYFQPAKRGELHELKEELHTTNKEKKKEAVKKVIAAMTVGKDVSSLFPDVVNCMQTTNIELKKLVYLYVINYAKAQPELAILAVNTFRKDSLDPSPLIRALAMRTMGCIRLEDIAEYLVEPLQRGCRDPDPYVRKTAAVGITKLFDIRADMVEEEGFIEELTTMLGDSNAVVVANAVAALAEISEKSRKNILERILNENENNVNKLLTALNECTEWGRVFILDALVTYAPPTPHGVVESVIDDHLLSIIICLRVVLSAIKVIMRLLDRVTNQEVVRAVQKKLSPPLVTLLSAEPEIQYVALRNIDLIVQKRPSILANEIKVFFCKYNDPVYVKLEKLEVLVRLASEKNVDQVVSELREYATEVDVDFVRKAVRSVGRCALKIESAAGRCLSVLLSLIHSKVNYVVQEAVVVVKDIFRKYPNQFDSMIPRLCDDLDALYEPAAKASMVWILGEYVDCIPNAEKLLETFLETFIEEPAPVQLQLLTAAVKMYLKRPAHTKQLVTSVLEKATDEGFNADLRDRAYIYWRMLSRDPEASKKVILAPKPPINDDADALDYKTLDILIGNIGMLASVYHKVPETFAGAAAPMPPPGRVAGGGGGGGSSVANEKGGRSKDKKTTGGATVGGGGGSSASASTSGGKKKKESSTTTITTATDRSHRRRQQQQRGGGGGGPSSATETNGGGGAGGGSGSGGGGGGRRSSSSRQQQRGTDFLSEDDEEEEDEHIDRPHEDKGHRKKKGREGEERSTSGKHNHRHRNRRHHRGGGGGHEESSSSSSASSSSSSSGDEEDNSPAPRSAENGSTDLLGLNEDPPTTPQTPTFPQQRPIATVLPQRVVLAPDQPGIRQQQRGLQIEAALDRPAGGGIQLFLTVTNRGCQTTVSDWSIQFNRNSFGLAPASPLQLPALRVGAAASAMLPVLPGVINSETAPTFPLALQVAVKTNIDEFYFLLPYSLHVVLLPHVPIEKETFRSKWLQLGEERQGTLMAAAAAPVSSAALSDRLRSGNIFHIAQWTTYTFDTHYVAAKTVNELLILTELSVQKDGNLVKLVVRSDSPALVPLFNSFVCGLLGLTPQTRPVAAA